MLEKGNVYYENLEAFSKNLQDGLHKVFPEVFLKKEKELKASILKASNQYIFDENKSMWAKTWFKEAYIAYFILTQTSRLHYVFNRINGLLDFSKIDNIVDFGCGPASAHLAAQAVFKDQLRQSQWTNIDSAKEAISVAKKIESHFKLNSSYEVSKKIPPPKTHNDLIILSFALCEGLDTETLFEYKHILILEPGQFTQSKKLIALRKTALEKKFIALAPCPHQTTCPMTEGKKNWCHDTAPKPKNLPSYNLPFSNERLSFSYLLLSDQVSTAKSNAVPKTRVIGDLRLEKGKSKIAICNGEKPLFLSWLKKSKLDFNLSRGDLINLPKEALEKGQEIRIETGIKKIEPI